MTRNRIKSIDEKDFNFCWNLYESAFPMIEKRPLDYHLEAMEIEGFHFELILEEGKHIGFIAWWDLEGFRYIEHFATSDEVRGQGYGKKLLNEFLKETTKPVILEVEHPETEISRRRIEFYKRLGFHLNKYEYFQPSYYSKNGERVCLLVMTYPQPISEKELKEFVENSLPIIHFRYFS